MLAQVDPELSVSLGRPLFTQGAIERTLRIRDKIGQPEASYPRISN